MGEGQIMLYGLIWNCKETIRHIWYVEFILKTNIICYIWGYFSTHISKLDGSFLVTKRHKFFIFLEILF